AFALAARRHFDVVCCSFVLEKAESALVEAVEKYLAGGGILVGAAGNTARRQSFEFVRTLPGAIAVPALAPHPPMLGTPPAAQERYAVGAPGEPLAVVDRCGRVDLKWRGRSSGAAALIAGVVALALSAGPLAAERAGRA